MKPLFIILLSSFFFLPENNISDKDWKLIKQKEDIEVFARKTFSGYKAVKVNASIETNLENFLDVVNDADNYIDWVYGCADSKILYDEGQIIEYSILTDMPFPVSDRYLEVRSTQELNGDLWISRSYAKRVDPPSKNIVVVDVFESEWIVFEKDGFVEIDYEVFSEPGGYIPAWMYNLAISKGPLNTMNSLKELLESKNSPNSEITEQHTKKSRYAK